VPTRYGDPVESDYALVLVHAEGLVGIGEAPAERWWTGEDAVTVRNAVERYLAPALSAFTGGLRTAARAMDAAVAANPTAKAAVEMALWDVLGKAVGQPLHVLLGGGEPRSVPVKYGIGAVEPARAREGVAAGKELGFAWFKVKGDGELEADLARFEAVAAALGPGDRFGVDINGAWAPEVALATVASLAELGVAFLEQPVERRFPAALAEIASRAAMPVVVHESLFTVEDGARAAAERIGQIWALTPGTHGGVLPTVDLLMLARAHGIGCLLGSTFELGVATALLAHVGSAFDEIALGTIPSDLVGPLVHAEDVIAEPLRIVDGRVPVPAGAGLGVDLDWERVEAFRV
jgi:L-alanine-DL-glutamate epimerase-like enolase superfamily enzyme